MASGCLLFLGIQKRKSFEHSLEKVPPILVLAMIVGIMYFPMSWAAASTVAIVILTSILIASLKEQTATYNFFTNPKVVYIGLISYSLYLWHWGVLSISRWTIGIHWWTVPFQVALMFVLAITSYRYVETPLRNGNWLGNRWKTIVVGGGVLVTLSVGLIALIDPLKGRLYTGKKINSEYIKQPPELVGDKCLENISRNTLCIFIDNKSKQTIWILGDSHAHVLNLAGEKVANSSGMNFKLYRASGTPFPPVGHYRKSNKKDDLQSIDDFRLVEKELYRQIKVGDVILLSMRIPYHFGGTYYEFPPSDFIFINKDGSFGSQENYFDNWISSVINLANLAQKKGTKIIIQTPTPEWEREKNKLCSSKNNQWFNALQNRNCKIDSKFFVDEEKGIYKNTIEKLNQLSSSYENIYLFDTYKLVCPDTKCNFTRNGVDIYADGDHISPKWARDFLSSEIYKFIWKITD